MKSEHFCRRPTIVRAIAALAVMCGAVACDSMLTRPSLYNSVSVVATRRNGDPIPGVQLVLYTGQRPMGYGATDSSGQFTFTRVPQGDYGVQVTALPDGYDLIEHLIESPASTVIDKLRVADDTLSPLHFTFLKRGPGTITVRVADAAGAPLPGVYAVLYSPTRVVDSLPADSTGVATFNDVPYGAYGVSLTRPIGFRSFARFEDSLYAHRDGLVVEEGVVDSVEFPLARCSALLRVHVTDQNGAPVAGGAGELYTSKELVARTFADQSGVITYPRAPCATPLGTRALPPPGYAGIPGRGTEYIDGFVLANGETRDINLSVRKLP
jgi:hypothetical protein